MCEQRADTGTAVDEAGEDAANGVVDPSPGRTGMADSYMIAVQRASRTGVRVTAQSQEAPARRTGPK